MSIEDEMAQLGNTPRSEVAVLAHGRCHICGQVEPDLVRFDTHINGGIERYACAQCNPERGSW